MAQDNFDTTTPASLEADLDAALPFGWSVDASFTATAGEGLSVEIKHDSGAWLRVAPVAVSHLDGYKVMLRRPSNSIPQRVQYPHKQVAYSIAECLDTAVAKAVQISTTGS